MIAFLKQYLQWRKLRRDLFSEWNEKYSRVAVQLEVERLQKEIFMVTAEQKMLESAEIALRQDLVDAQIRLKAIEDYV